MARDKTARERGKSDVTLDRRAVLGAAAGGVATAFGLGTLASATDTAGASEYRTVTVSGGDKEHLSVGDGETLENVLIDMTADGASAQITTSGSGWTIRNVAFKGNHPGGHYLLTPGVDSEDGEGLIENVYMGDGQTARSGSGGVWVNGNMPHRGTITFRNVHIAQMIDNGLYGMDSGYSGVGGVVNVEDSYFDSNNIANIRVGSLDGRTCTVRNCVVTGGETRPCGEGCSSPGATNSRGVWAWWGPVEVRDSDVGSSPARVVNTGREGDPEIISTNTRWGDDANTDRVPDGVPMTPEEAASGSGTTDSGSSDGTSGSDGGGQGTDGGSGSENGPGTVLELVSATDTSNVEYQFTVEGSVSRRTDAGDNAAEDNDEFTENDDGTVTVSGVAGNGYGDSFLVEGTVVSTDLNESDWTIRYGGEEVTVGDLVLPNELVIDGSNRPRVPATYTFAVSGRARKSAELGSVNAHDTVSGGEIAGRVIGGTDGFRFSGDITGFSIDGAADVTVDEND